MAVKEKIGIVVSDKMKDTRIVAVNDRVIHKRYKKVITRTRRYAVQDSIFNSTIPIFSFTAISFIIYINNQFKIRNDFF
jgi:hypothetical protein